MSVDVKAAIEPCLNVAYALATLFLVLAFFVFRDFIQFDIRQSWRVWLFAPYVLVCLIAFLPFWHLHNVMVSQRTNLIEANNRVIEEEIFGDRRDGETAVPQFDPRKLIVSVEKIERMQSFYGSIPIWPTKLTDLIFPNMSVAISLATLAYKLFDTVKATIK